jgi:hypothetical protein
VKQLGLFDPVKIHWPMVIGVYQARGRVESPRMTDLLGF